MDSISCDGRSDATAEQILEHLPVLVGETMQALAIKPDGIYVDATFGRGGHSRALLRSLDVAGRLLAFDRDPEALHEANRLAQADPRIRAEQRSFSQLPGRLASLGLTRKIDGLLLDLGVSSPQLDTPQRGFSFLHDGPLDMRMDPSQGEPVSAWLAHTPAGELTRVLKEYGEERFAGRIARAIAAELTRQPLLTTRALAQLIERTAPTREPGKHPATRSFQALRIAINQELDELRTLLAGVVDLLAVGGRLAVISFHSLEDRIVKHFIRDQARGSVLPKSVPVQGDACDGALRAVGKPVRPSQDEVSRNPRSRSARLRVAERLP